MDTMRLMVEIWVKHIYLLSFFQNYYDMLLICKYISNILYMNHFIGRLPMDIVLKIIPYTYNLQKKSLLDDIVHFIETKETLFELYHAYWVEPNEDKNWLINDIFAYANNYQASMHGYIDSFYHIFKRNAFSELFSKEEIDRYVSHLEKKSVETQINIFLGLFTVKERNDVVMAAPRTVDI